MRTFKRTIKFRGKRLDNGEWVTGYFYQLPLPSGVATVILTTDNCHSDNSPNPKHHLAFTLWVDLFLVDPRTVGQFTGLYDKNGREIYEGDILSVKEPNGNYNEAAVEWCNKGYWAVSFGISDRIILGFVNRELLEVIGNIHDKGGEQ